MNLEEQISQNQGVDRQADLERFYGLIGRVRERCNGGRLLSQCDGRSGWPERGVYFFFEPGELRADGHTPRVVRVGTHALMPAKSTLWGRLSQHRGTVDGSMPGGGNHRGSIFRLQIGAAMLASGAWSHEIRRTWGVGGSAERDVREAEYPLERAVSAYLGAMHILWVEVNDEPSTTSERGAIERGAIALLSNLEKPALDPPSPGWLGHRSDRFEIRQSGLWNVNHVDGRYRPSFLDVFERWIG